jgi:gliding motility-associated-like protein
MGVDIPYGLAFSSSGNVLYIDWYDGVNTITYISSFDMTAGVGLIAATQQDYLIGSGVEYGALTRGPDGKIYGARQGFTNLISINTPENYLAPTINLSGHDPSPGTVNIGMPNMAYYNHPDNFIDSLAGADRVVCPNGQANIGATGNDSIWGTYYWEPSAMVMNPNNATTLTVPLPVNQEFILAVVNNCGDTVTRDTVFVTINPLIAALSTNAPICQNQALSLNSTPTGLPSGSYNWTGPGGPMGGAGLATINILPFPSPIAGGWYYVEITDGACSSTDSVFVQVDSVYNLSINQTVCSGSNYNYADGTISLNILTNESHVSNLISIAGCDSNVTENLTVVLASANVPEIFTPTSWYCSNDNITDLTSDIGDLWYSDPALISQIGTDTSFTPSMILGTNTYYVIDTTGGCYSLADSVTVTFENCPDPCATNILANGDFESYSSCPTGPSDLANATSWLNIQSSSNDYFNCGYFGHPSGLTYPSFWNSIHGMFYPPSGTGYAGFIIGGTGIGKEGFGQQVELKKCVEYTIQFRMAISNIEDSLENDVCLYIGNSATTTGCMSGYTSMGCISKDSVNMNWNVFTITFTPSQNYSYLALSGACPSTGASGIGGYVYIDDVFLCADTCANQATALSSITMADDTCANSTGIITVGVTTPCYTGLIFDWSIFGSTVSTDSVALGLAAGIYDVTVTDSNACTISTTVTVTSIGATTAPSVSNDTTYCENELFADMTCGGSNVSWYSDYALTTLLGTGGTYTPSNTIGATTYYVTAGLAPCISPIDSAVITVITMPDAGIDGAHTFCTSDSPTDLFADLGGAPEAGGTWSPVLVSATGVFDPGSDPAGTYLYVVAGTNPCGNDTSEVIVTITTSVNAGNDVSINICPAAGTITLTDSITGSPDLGGQWNPLLNSSTSLFDPSVDVSGIYEYVVGIGGTCGTDTSVININVYPTPDPGTNGTLTICSNSLIVDLFNSLGGSPNTGGVWTPTLISTTGVFDPLSDPSGTYTYTVSATSNCPSASSNVVVSVTTAPAAGVDGSAAICPAAGPVDLLDSLGGSPDITGSWNPILTSGTGVFDPTIDAAGTYEYVVLGSGGCANDTSEVVVTIYSTPNPGTNGTLAICSNSTPVDLFNSLNGSPNTGGTWSPTLTSGTGFFNPLSDPAGTYTYSVSATPSCPTASAEVLVTLTSAPDAGGNSTVSICSNGTAFTFTDSLSGTPDLGGAWTPAISGTLFDPAINTSGTYTYTVTGAGGCLDATATITVSVNATPAVNLGSTTSFCEGDSLLLDAGNSGSSYLWSPGGETSQTVSVSLIGTYTVNVTSSAGCLGTGSISVTESSLPIHSGFVGSDICIGETAMLVTFGSGSLVWNTTEINDTIYVNPTSDTWYYSTYTNSCGSVTDSILITVHPLPTIIAGNDTTVAILQDALLWATGGVNYVWSPSTGLDCPTCWDPIANNTTSQVYYVTGVDSNGCVGSDSVIVIVDGNLDLFVPNVFSPNGDNNNDLVFVRGGPFQEFQFSIFNRWGEIVFETTDQTIGWDGTFKTKLLDPAVFVYKVTYTDWQGESGEVSGNITLIK